MYLVSFHPCSILPLVSDLHLRFRFFCLAQKIDAQDFYFFFTVCHFRLVVRDVQIVQCGYPRNGRLWDRFIYLGVAFIPIFLYHFGLIYGTITSQKYVLHVGYALATFFFLVVSKRTGREGSVHL